MGSGASADICPLIARHGAIDGGSSHSGRRVSMIVKEAFSGYNESGEGFFEEVNMARMPSLAKLTGMLLLLITTALTVCSG
jgi:hypothetical protein